MKTLCVATDFDVRLCKIRHLKQLEADTDTLKRLSTISHKSSIRSQKQ